MSDHIVPARLGDGYIYTVEVSGIEEKDGGARVFSVADTRPLDEIAPELSALNDGPVSIVFQGITVQATDGSQKLLGKRLLRIPPESVVMLAYDDRFDEALDALLGLDQDAESEPRPAPNVLRSGKLGQLGPLKRPS